MGEIGLKKLVLFGAGKIGRSFIAQLFARSDYEVVFIDVNIEIIDALNAERGYKVIVRDDLRNKELWIKNVSGIHTSNVKEIIDEITKADILAISVGQENIPKVATTIALGIVERHKKRPAYPIDIILAENLRNAALLVGKELDALLGNSIDRNRYVGLIETSIGKMVPIMPVEISEGDPLLTYAEPYNTLILDKLAFKNPIPDVLGLAPKENMAAWVDRKFFIHNLGHAAAAYYGYDHYPGSTYMHEILAKKDVYDFTKSVMRQAADTLRKMYPNAFTKMELEDHIDDLIHRFSNKSLGDTVYRVGQDLYRKLGPEDRVVCAIREAMEHAMPYDKILRVIDCATRFEAENEHGLRTTSDIKFCKAAKKGLSYILEEVCGISQTEFPEVHTQLK